MVYDASGQRAVIWMTGFYGYRGRSYDMGRWKTRRPITRAVITGIAACNPLGPDTSRISSFCDNVGCNLVAGLIAIWHQRHRISYCYGSLRMPTSLTAMHRKITDTNLFTSVIFRRIFYSCFRISWEVFNHFKCIPFLERVPYAFKDVSL